MWRPLPSLLFALHPAPYRPVNRQVEPHEGEKLAQTNKAAWVETSAKNDINVGGCSVNFAMYVV